MLGLPPSTELNKPLPKTAVFAKFALTAKQREHFDADISRMTLVNAVSPHTVPALAEGGEVKSFYVLSVQLKRKDYDANPELNPVRLNQEPNEDATAEYVEERGYPVLNFNDPEVLEESGMDGTDFMDTKHLNAKGARTFSEYFSDFLYETLAADTEVQDHRGEEGYESWDEALENYEVFYEETLETMREQYPELQMEFES